MNILEKQESKLFQPLPLRNNIIPKHIILDTACIINLFCPEKDKEGNKIKKGELLSNVKDNQNEVWSNLLNLKHKIFKNTHYQFHNQIQTDGISCCLLFIRKDLKDKKWGAKVPVMEEQDFYNIEDLSKEQLDTKDRNIVGCDRGKRSLVYRWIIRETNYNTQHHREKEKANQNVIKEFCYMKERKMELLKKKHNYHFKIVNQLIMTNLKCILLKRIN